MLSQLDSPDPIQVLSLFATTVELWDVIMLIKTLPKMSDLIVKSTCLGPLSEGITMDELAEYVISTSAPMDEHFRCWHIDRSVENIYTAEAKCVLLPVLACPNFTFAAVPHRRRNECVALLETEIASDMFKPDAPRLQCLVA
ncbi:hypothetical protein GGI16_000481 [Coemansia sp. S142-1]|nr:hypothetical protein GGI16_000481 [Coemansia sp. S142-1]